MGSLLVIVSRKAAFYSFSALSLRFFLTHKTNSLVNNIVCLDFILHILFGRGKFSSIILTTLLFFFTYYKGGEQSE